MGKMGPKGGNNQKKASFSITLGSNLTYAESPRTIFHRCQVVPWDPRNAKRMFHLK